MRDDALADLLDRLRAIGDRAGIDVDVVGEPLEDAAFETPLMTGATAWPTTEPAPVVNTIMWQPLATISVTVWVSLMLGMP